MRESHILFISEWQFLEHPGIFLQPIHLASQFHHDALHDLLLDLLVTFGFFVAFADVSERTSEILTSRIVGAEKWLMFQVFPTPNWIKYDQIGKPVDVVLPKELLSKHSKPGF